VLAIRAGLGPHVLLLSVPLVVQLDVVPVLSLMAVTARSSGVVLFAMSAIVVGLAPIVTLPYALLDAKVRV